MPGRLDEKRSLFFMDKSRMLVIALRDMGVVERP
jgi:hypothetical protein